MSQMPLKKLRKKKVLIELDQDLVRLLDEKRSQLGFTRVRLIELCIHEYLDKELKK